MAMAETGSERKTYFEEALDQVMRGVNIAPYDLGSIKDLVKEQSISPEDEFSIFFSPPLAGMILEEAGEQGFTDFILEDSPPAPMVFGVKPDRDRETENIRAREGTLIVYTRYADKLKAVYDNDPNEEKKNARQLVHVLLAAEKAKITNINNRVSDFLDKIRP